MLNPDLPDIAVAGDLGIDVFRRTADLMKGRAQYSCLCTVRTDASGTRKVDSYGRHAARNTRQMLDAAAALDQDAALQARFALARPSEWPRAGAGPDALRIFQYLDFFRAWQVADMAIARFEASQGAPDLAEAATVLRLLTDFNMIRRGVPLARRMLPQFRTSAGLRTRTQGAAPARRHAEAAADATDEAADRFDNTGYSLRLIGDLLARNGDHAQALAAFEAAILCADNRFRRRRAIISAHAAGDHDRARHHLSVFAESWGLPGDLSRLRARLQPGAPPAAPDHPPHGA